MKKSAQPLKRKYFYTDESIEKGVVLVGTNHNNSHEVYMEGHLCDNKKIKMPQWSGWYKVADLKEY